MQGSKSLWSAAISGPFLIEGYVAVGCAIADQGAWVDAPDDAIISWLKELPEDRTPLRHKHIMFGHAYKV